MTDKPAIQRQSASGFSVSCTELGTKSNIACCLMSRTIRFKFAGVQSGCCMVAARSFSLKSWAEKAGTHLSSSSIKWAKTKSWAEHLSAVAQSVISCCIGVSWQVLFEAVAVPKVNANLPWEPVLQSVKLTDDNSCTARQNGDHSLPSNRNATLFLAKTRPAHANNIQFGLAGKLALLGASFALVFVSLVIGLS